MESLLWLAIFWCFAPIIDRRLREREEQKREEQARGEVLQKLKKGKK